MRINDGRSLIGGIALVITGATLSIMTYLYFEERFTGAEILKSRWLWEIILNLQILSIGCMWFCYADRIKSRDTVKAQQMKVRMLLSLFAVLVPTWIMLLTASMGWFEDLPPQWVIDLLFLVMLGYWLLSAIIPRLMVMQAEGRYLGKHLLVRRFKYLWHVLPFMSALTIAVVDLLRGTQHYYLCVPFLFYTQAAVPYFLSGLTFEKPRESLYD